MCTEGKKDFNIWFLSSHISNDGTHLAFPCAQLIKAYFPIHRFIYLPCFHYWLWETLGWAPMSVQISKKISLAGVHLLMGDTQTAWWYHLLRVFLLRKEWELQTEIKIYSGLHTSHFLMFTDSAFYLFFYYLPKFCNLSEDIQQSCWQSLLMACRRYIQWYISCLSSVTIKV